MKVNADFSIDAVVRNMSRAKTIGTAGLARGVMASAGLLMERSLAICPIDTGELRASAFVRKVDDLHAEVGYSAEHAAAVHERLDLNHEPPTQAKFLERPMNELREEMLAVQTREVQRWTDEQIVRMLAPSPYAGPRRRGAK